MRQLIERLKEAKSIRLTKLSEKIFKLIAMQEEGVATRKRPYSVWGSRDIAACGKLMAAGLIEAVGSADRSNLYRLTKHGRKYWKKNYRDEWHRDGVKKSGDRFLKFIGEK